MKDEGGEKENENEGKKKLIFVVIYNSKYFYFINNVKFVLMEELFWYFLKYKE